MDDDTPAKGPRPANLRAAAAVLRQRAAAEEEPHDKDRLLQRAEELVKKAAELDFGQVLVDGAS